MADKASRIEGCAYFELLVPLALPTKRGCGARTCHHRSLIKITRVVKVYFTVGVLHSPQSEVHEVVVKEC